ncbi:MAG TPA: sulfotransferase domain-containing protein [Cyclobacteriaceae bacterium]|nr:sulfotransferase domain-containing protein [Cyclobacteriaceae bacterium]
MTSNKFIILTPGRSGSTYLQQLLNSDPAISCYDEIFNVANKNNNSFYSFCRTNNPKISFFFLRGKFSRSSWNFPLAYLFRQYLKSIYIKTSATKIGFKLIYNQLLHYHPLASWVSGNPIPIIHLQRKNLLKAAISHIKARSTGIYTSTSVSLEKRQKINISPAAILNELRSSSAEKLKCESLIRNNPSITIYYEDLFKNLPSTIQQLQAFLHIENVSFQKPDIVKTNPDRIDEIIENYDDLKKVLRGTDWEGFLD